MEILSNLSVYLSNPRTTLNNKLLKICMTVKSAIPTCDRVGIWLFCSDYSEMISIMCVDELGQQSVGESLIASECAAYFAHLRENEFLDASDARNNAITKLFNNEYFDVHNIHSLLDITFKQDFLPLGVICCERTGDQTKWQSQDIKTLQSISLKASVFISNNISDTYVVRSKESIINMLNN
jgi:GAF domain-containing protein